MQPYFFPYAGYYRLLKHADAFVIFDNAQFPRRGRVHRADLSLTPNENLWLTLPISKAPQKTQISEIEFNGNSITEFRDKLLDQRNVNWDSEFVKYMTDSLFDFNGTLLDYLARQIDAVKEFMSFDVEVHMASEISVRDEDLTAQEYIIEIGKKIGAQKYLNSPGGKLLYSPEEFIEASMDLEFLPPYEGPGSSVLVTPEALAEIAIE